MTGKSVGLLGKRELVRFARCPVRCARVPHRITSLADYISSISTPASSGDFWFRGHAKAEWNLIPSALRYSSPGDSAKALHLLNDFKRVAEIKIDRPPQGAEQLKWVQLAQHYGLPTPMLDWTVSSVIALHFACAEPTSDGVVFIMNPVDLNRLSYPTRPRVLDAHSDAELIARYLKLPVGSSPRRAPQNTIAVNPVWNSSRLMAQKGVFTLHGKRPALDKKQAPSLVAVFIMKEHKNQLRTELERIGVDEMTLFPELEHACAFLKHKAGLL